MKQRLLILGGVDFIGGLLARQLVHSDAWYPVLAGLGATALGDVESLECDPTDAQAIRKLLDGVAGVVNCVAGDAQLMLRSANTLFSAAVRAGSPPVLQLSTMAAYGSATGPIAEDAALLGDVDAYSAVRAEVDRLAGQYGSTRLRPGIIYGPGSMRWSGQIAALLCAQRLGDLGAAGDGRCNLVLVDDLLKAMHHCLARVDQNLGAINLCGAEQLTWNEYFIRYAIALGAVPVQRITRRRLKMEVKLFAPPLKLLEMLLRPRVARHLGLPELISPSLLRVCGQELLLDNCKAEQILGMQWAPVDYGLQKAAQWYRDAYRVV